ncbi:MAG: hypothetical protein AAF565_12445, partial [Pseudomonadota bacterium]
AHLARDRGPGWTGTMPNNRTTSALAQARALLPDLDASGLTVAAYCREHGISTWAMYKAAREHRAESPSTTADGPALTEVAIVDGDKRFNSPAAPLEIGLPAGLRIHVPVDFDEVTLRRLLGVLAAC